ncbi:MAG TPA: HAMP domain-containing sensor histidine kinase [Nostocaceae cyanobacterium]|nr:HAMP domain-containing sensor histidine kinase [Nostocaceae cyanobacterium]
MMKVATPRLIAPMHLPSLENDLARQKLLIDVNKICQLIIRQIALLLPTVAVWTVYQDLDLEERQLVTDYAPESIAAGYANSSLRTGSLVSEQFNFDLSDLQQEKWLSEDLAILTVTEVNVPGCYAYVCCVGENRLQAAEYIFICTCEVLASGQKQLLLDNAQILGQYLAMYKEHKRQHKEISALSEALGRTEHQLRNPLALINLYAENLRLALPSGSLQEQAMLIRQTVDELSSKLTDLIFYGQKAKLEIKHHDLSRIVAESVQGLQPWVKQKELQISYPDQPVYVKVDAWQMKQVFDNLFTNAIYFSPQGGIVLCNLHVYSNEILVEIYDHGSGISESDLKQIFKPYYSRRLGGTGLGLAIAQKIIRDHQGSLWAENIPGGGAQFSFTLPR